MKKLLFCFILMFSSVCLFVFDSTRIEAKQELASKSLNTISGETVGLITIYNNGEIVLKYKYGLRKAVLYYCEKGDRCDYNMYNSVKIMESSEIEPYKNNGKDLMTFSYKAQLDGKKEYKLKVEAYFGVSVGYRGTESIFGSPAISSVQILEIDDEYVKLDGNSDYGDQGINDLMVEIKDIVNTIVLPLLYAVMGLFLVVKGTILGVQIVKAADEPNLRLEKIRALKWLAIGVGIGFVASTLVGALTGFFQDAFN